jgi:hypothetical protein
MQTGDPFDGVSDTTHLLTDLVDIETSYGERRNEPSGLRLRRLPLGDAVLRFSTPHEK